MAAAKTCTLRTRKFMNNPLLRRRQFLVEVLHEGRPNVPKNEIRAKLATLYKAPEGQIFVWGFQTAFGGGRSSGFGVIYDDMESATKFEPKYRQIRNGTGSRSDESRKLRKDKKNRAKKFRGKERTAILRGKGPAKKK
jgi:small subunit ribosomal protein S24e